MFVVQPSQFYDKVSAFYILLTAIPAAAFIFCHIFSVLCRNLFDSPEKEYEKMLAIIHMEAEKADFRLKQLEARRLMRERGDGPWYHYEH
ncbi:hypothetical protein GDO86_010068 [Hymenochirus boettgeri]|uniref:NADH dehydrogenase [ubiquinone] 1 beta subcomplex subunit 5, mitochondrial n=1 Tax=Hymenochirus boettgeri TaxID=247094 RepID=A0A8T2JRW0_9PIPI|nr:hypothetical protein GDO86_010068 [Hymenochirus boettgeri]